MAQVGTTAELTASQDDGADEQMYNTCTCDGNIVRFTANSVSEAVLICPDGATLCTQSECEAAYPGICPKCTNANIALSANTDR